MTAMMWLKELINLLNEEALLFIPGILNVALPCFSYGDENFKKNILLKISQFLAYFKYFIQFNRLLLTSI